MMCVVIIGKLISLQEVTVNFKVRDLTIDAARIREQSAMGFRHIHL